MISIWNDLRTVFRAVFWAAILCLGFSQPVAAGEGFPAGPYLEGRLIVATENITDPIFKQTVILMLEHDQEGAFGVVLNRPIATGPLIDMMTGFGMEPEFLDEAAASRIIDLRNGGPVEPESAMAVHSTDYHEEGSYDVGSGLAWSLESAILEHTAAGRGPERMLVFFGYAGWSGGQLEKEISRGDWLDADASSSIVFGTPPHELYDLVRDAAGLSL